MRRITLFDCIVATAAYYEVERKKITGTSRQRRYTVPRQVTMHVAKRLTNLSLPQIASRLGDRDHTTILHGIRTIKAQMDEPTGDIRKAVLAICEKLYDDLYRDQINAAWGLGKACRALSSRKRDKPFVTPIFLERVPLSELEQITPLPRTRAPRRIPIHASQKYVPSTFIRENPKSRLMGARA